MKSRTPRHQDRERPEPDQPWHNALERPCRRKQQKYATSHAAATATTPSWRIRPRCPRNSGREPATDPTLLKTNATVFVTFAVTGARPTASSAG